MKNVAQPAVSRAALRRYWPIHLLALGCYTLLALLVTYPMPLHIGERIIANQPGQVDGYLGIWNIWWTARALSGLHDPFTTPLLFYPQGLDLFWQTLSLPQGLLALPFTLIFGPLPAYNLLILASFVLGGYFCFLFVRSVLRAEQHRAEKEGRSKLHPYARGVLSWSPYDLAALVAGAVYAFAPFHIQKVLDAQLEVAAIQWLPLYAWALLSLLERPRWTKALLAGLLLLWVGLGTWYYGLFALICTGFAAVLWLVRKDEGALRLGSSALSPQPSALSFRLGSSSFILHPSSFLWGLSPILIWLALMSPRLLSLAQTGDTLLGDARVEQIDAAADLVAFWLPNPNHPLWGTAVSRYYQGHYPEAILWNVSLGIVGTLLALWGLAGSWRRHWRWVTLGVIAAVLAMGSELNLFGWKTGLPLPYALLRDLPGIRTSHRPNHFVLITILVVALMAGAGALRLLQGRRPGLIATTLLTAILAVDGWAGPLPLYARTLPAPYLSMPAPDGALLPVPLHLNFSNSENLWYQTYHHWPIIGGFIGREPPYPLGRYLPGISELRFGHYEPDDILSPGWPELARESLAAYKIRYVMLHKPTMGSTAGLMRDIVTHMGLRARYDDDLIGVYPVPQVAQPRPLAYLGAGWGNLERDGERRWRWMGASAQLYLLNPTDAPLAVDLTLDMEAFETDRPLSLRLGNAEIFSLEVGRARSRQSLRLLLPPGETVLYLVAPPGSPPGQPERQLSIAMLGISIK